MNPTQYIMNKMNPTQSKKNSTYIIYPFFYKFGNDNKYIYFDPLQKMQMNVNYEDPKYTIIKMKALTDLEKYDKITSLEIDGHNLTKLPDKLPINLKFLSCMNNKLTSLPNLPNTLKYLDILNNPISELPNNLPNSLEELHIGYTNISRLPSRLPANLKILYCSMCPLEDNEVEQYKNKPFLLIFHKGKESKSKYKSKYKEDKPKKHVHMCLDRSKQSIIELYSNQLDIEMCDDDKPKKHVHMCLDRSKQSIIELDSNQLDIEMCDDDSPPDNWDSSDGE